MNLIVKCYPYIIFLKVQFFIKGKVQLNILITGMHFLVNVKLAEARDYSP